MGAHWTAWVTLAALGMYSWVLYMVGKARGKFGIFAPNCDGPVEFLSVLRVQANTVEQMVAFFPALWTCAVFDNDVFAASCGAVWVVARIMYARGYYQDPKKRSTGFLISSFTIMALILGTAYGLVMHG
ncbi:MAG: MAPEG family protein [Burkholderiaceae bacterium]|nr:MAPEG family protein [Burkholderiaceae bacterium]